MRRALCLGFLLPLSVGCFDPEAPTGPSTDTPAGSSTETSVTAPPETTEGALASTSSGASPPSSTSSGPAPTSAGEASTTEAGSTAVDGSTTPTTGGQVTVTFGEREIAIHRGTTTNTHLRELMPLLNYGTHEDIHVSGNLGATDDAGIEVGLLRFELTELPPGTPIVSAELWLRFVVIEAVGTIEVHAVEEAWDAGVMDSLEGVANWHNRTAMYSWSSPGLQDTLATGEPVAIIESFTTARDVIVELDVDVVQGWVDDPASNHGLAFSTEDADTWIVATHGSIRPEPEYQDAEPVLRITHVE